MYVSALGVLVRADTSRIISCPSPKQSATKRNPWESSVWMAPDQIFPPLDVLTEQRAQKHKLLFFIPDMRLLYCQLHLPQTVQHPFLPPGFFRGK